MVRNDEVWMMNIPQDYTERLIYKTLLNDIVTDIENGRQDNINTN